MADPFQCGLVLLAAGASKRMGRPKQLLPVQGLTLVRHVAELVLRAPVSPVVVVVGADAQKIEPALAGLPVQITLNPNWSEGLGSSLRVGVDAALELAPKLQGLIVALADQPGLPPNHLEKLIGRFRQGGCSLVASQTGLNLVPPVLFGAEWFPRLRILTGDSGARDILRENRPDFGRVILPDNTDLDTHEDYERYLKEHSS
ncbi:nucleotidyltransferase family protein [Oleiharenicola lentus]|uniref:Nucleotidyltransferase family protein n=1 Tax=Oleiharenicola lentus TaxID=2508720 RepID=A0A4Q1C533_9BACT|nr:nucleotidyltransferase family protein [Oleiharenicola lentus]RXK53389.1 nucleotidyltransferase family protein [Oleiharenicola lentus]